ncbi:MAG: DUF2520 domain-containing protein [Cytophagales bacterium]|nr:MAG: DUF2520 domain-containing protein [Cytophagales bacterium]
MSKIALIGAGNVSSHLASIFTKKGHTITEIYSRKLQNAAALASSFAGVVPTDRLDFSESKAEFFLVSVTDNALENVLNQLVTLPNAIIAHTSGSHPLSIIPQSTQAGIFYPLQTFSKSKEVNFEQIPICLEANNKHNLLLMRQLASSISHHIYEFDSEERQILHLAAVFSCNFSNFLFTISKHILEKNKKEIPFDILKPLISETLEKAFEISPENAQTGPAKRADTAIIGKHLALLDTLFTQNKAINKREENWKKIYDLLTKQIIRFYTK